MGNLQRTTPAALADPAIIEQARAYADAAQAPATRRAYGSDRRDFEAFCAARGLEALPATPQTVALYVTDLAGRAKISTIRRRLVAISQAHRERGLEPPTWHEAVRRIVRGIGRTNGSAQARKPAATLDALRAMLLAIDGDDLKAKRDRAILLLGFAAALRRSELAALDVADLRFCKEGLRVTLRRSKTDQAGEGAEIAVPFLAIRALCAVRAVREWLGAADITSGPVFRTFALNDGALTERRIAGQDVSRLVKALARRAQLDGDFSAHSLRAGFVTSAAAAKASLDSIARTTRHKSLAVLMGYIRPAKLFDDVALTSIFAKAVAA